MSNSSENDEDRLRAGGEVGIRESDHPLVDTESGGESVTGREAEAEKEDEVSAATGLESDDATGIETEDERGCKSGEESDKEKGEKESDRETDKESVPESGKDGDIETGSDDSARDSSLERHCEDYLAKKIGECLLV